MTNDQLDTVTLIYALGEAIKIKNWPDASAIWERLLLVYAPLNNSHPSVGPLLREQAALVYKRSNSIH
jgi:hypothetical protein